MIEFSENLGFTGLFRDFVYRLERIERFFRPEPCDAKAAHLARKTFARGKLADILTKQNRAWGAPAGVFKNIDRLRDGKAVVVFGGQQACLFGGPYMILLKALAVVKYARHVEEQSGIPVVPVFWIVSDDHDYGEISRVDVFDIGGNPIRLAIDHDPERVYPPVGALKYDNSIRREMERMRSLFPDNDFKAAALDPIQRIYSEGRRIADCFAEYLLDLTGHLGIVLFTPYDGDFKSEVSGFFSELVERFGEVKKGLREAEDDLIRAGYHRQVEKAETAVHLFFHDPGRQAVHFDGAVFRAGGKSFTEEELLRLIRSRPLNFSPDVITKPLVQSFFFPTLAVVGGPAEVAYYAQLMPLFELFDLVRPIILSRPSMTLVEARFEKLMRQHDYKFAQIALEIDDIIDGLMQQSFPDRWQRMIDDYSLEVEKGLEGLGREMSGYDPDLKGIFDRVGRKIDYQLKDLRERIFAAHKRKNKIERERMERLHNNLYPGRGLAERSIAPAYFISRYGRNVIDFIYDNLDIGATNHQLLMLSEYHE